MVVCSYGMFVWWYGGMVVWWYVRMFVCSYGGMVVWSGPEGDGKDISK